MLSGTGQSSTPDINSVEACEAIVSARLLDTASLQPLRSRFRNRDCDIRDSSSAIKYISNIAMRDLTQGSIVNHILAMAAPVAVSMLTQITYQLIDLYFVTSIGAAATAGVSAASTGGFILLALMQVLSVGTVALVAHAVGRQDQADANSVFNQSMMLSAVCGVITIVLLVMCIHPYLNAVAADTATIDAGATFVFWLLPGYALIFPMTVFSSALRGIGIVRPTIAFHVLTVVINAILAPVLIAGWGTGVVLGVKGAGLATSISIVVGTVVLAAYFHRSQRYMSISRRLMRPQFKQWNRILNVGLPIGGEVVLMFLSSTIVYYAIRNFGAYAQAGYGIGFRVMQTILLPGISVAFAVGPIVGQNFGAQKRERVREAFRKAVVIGTAVMIAAALFVHWRSKALVEMFDADASASAVAILFLQLMSWIFVAQGIVYTCSSTFQGLGNTAPSLLSSGIYFFVFSISLMWVSRQPAFRIEQVWHLVMAAATLQSIVSLWLLNLQLRRRRLQSSTPS